MNTFVRLTVLLGCLFLSFPLIAQTPDLETPSQESVCDSLLADDVTPGLYGLCNAFCEAQDCDSAEGEATTSCSSLLASYNRRAEGGPAMPCLEPADPSCPCWTENEFDSVTAVEFPFKLCGPAGDWEFAILLSANLSDDVWFSTEPMALGCFYRNTRNQPDDPPDDPLNPFDRNRMDITVEQDAACRADIREHCPLPLTP